MGKKDPVGKGREVSGSIISVRVGKCCGKF